LAFSIALPSGLIELAPAIAAFVRPISVLIRSSSTGCSLLMPGGGKSRDGQRVFEDQADYEALERLLDNACRDSG
jgi:hypothetical protein